MYTIFKMTTCDWQSKALITWNKTCPTYLKYYHRKTVCFKNIRVKELVIRVGYIIWMIHISTKQWSTYIITHSWQIPPSLLGQKKKFYLMLQYSSYLSPINQGCGFSFLPPFSSLRDSNKLRLVATVKKKLIERKTLLHTSISKYKWEITLI